MALPVSGPLSINDIRVELGQAQANSSLRSLSNLAGFSTPDAISEFYGYPPTPNYRTFAIVNIQYNDYSAACGSRENDNLTLYFYELNGDGTPACPTTSVTLYTDTALSSPFNGQDKYYKSNQCNASYYILGSPNRGFIEGISSCE
jgi:hypothetical protein